MPSPASYLDTKVRLTDGMTVESSLASAIVDFDALCFFACYDFRLGQNKSEMFTLKRFSFVSAFYKTASRYQRPLALYREF